MDLPQRTKQKKRGSNNSYYRPKKILAKYNPLSLEKVNSNHYSPNNHNQHPSSPPPNNAQNQQQKKAESPDYNILKQLPSLTNTFIPLLSKERINEFIPNENITIQVIQNNHSSLFICDAEMGLGAFLIDDIVDAYDDLKRGDLLKNVHYELFQTQNYNNVVLRISGFSDHGNSQLMLGKDLMGYTDKPKLTTFRENGFYVTNDPEFFKQRMDYLNDKKMEQFKLDQENNKLRPMENYKNNILRKPRCFTNEVKNNTIHKPRCFTNEQKQQQTQNTNIMDQDNEVNYNQNLMGNYYQSQNQINSLIASFPKNVKNFLNSLNPHQLKEAFAANNIIAPYHELNTNENTSNHNKNHHHSNNKKPEKDVLDFLGENDELDQIDTDDFQFNAAILNETLSDQNRETIQRSTFPTHKVLPPITNNPQFEARYFPITNIYKSVTHKMRHKTNIRINDKYNISTLNLEQFKKIIAHPRNKKISTAVTTMYDDFNPEHPKYGIYNSRGTVQINGGAPIYKHYVTKQYEDRQSFIVPTNGHPVHVDFNEHFDIIVKPIGIIDSQEINSILQCVSSGHSPKSIALIHGLKLFNFCKKGTDAFILPYGIKFIGSFNGTNQLFNNEGCLADKHYNQIGAEVDTTLEIDCPTIIRLNGDYQDSYFKVKRQTGNKNDATIFTMLFKAARFPMQCKLNTQTMHEIQQIHLEKQREIESKKLGFTDQKIKILALSQKSSQIKSILPTYNASSTNQTNRGRPQSNKSNRSASSLVSFYFFPKTFLRLNTYKLKDMVVIQKIIQIKIKTNQITNNINKTNINSNPPPSFPPKHNQPTQSQLVLISISDDNSIQIVISQSIPSFITSPFNLSPVFYLRSFCFRIYTIFVMVITPFFSRTIIIEFNHHSILKNSTPFPTINDPPIISNAIKNNFVNNNCTNNKIVIYPIVHISVSSISKNHKRFPSNYFIGHIIIFNIIFKDLWINYFFISVHSFMDIMVNLYCIQIVINTDFIIIILENIYISNNTKKEIVKIKLIINYLDSKHHGLLQMNYGHFLYIYIIDLNYVSSHILFLSFCHWNFCLFFNVLFFICYSPSYSFLFLFFWIITISHTFILYFFAFYQFYTS